MKGPSKDEKWQKENICQLLDRNPKAVIRGIMAIYSLQTKEEQFKGKSIEHNGQGFGKSDVKFFTNLIVNRIHQNNL